MALPDGVLSTEVIQGRFLYPDSRTGTRLEDYEMGGIALGNSSQGLQYQPWYGRWNPDTLNVELQANFSGPFIVLFSEPDVLEFSFSFDQNMRWVAATLASTGVLKFRWYDATVPGYVTTTYSNVSTMKLALDDKRAAQVSSDHSDILLTYVKLSGELYYRLQRERYLAEHLLDTDISDKLRITNFGMTDKLRVQWRFQSKSYSP